MAHVLKKIENPNRNNDDLKENKNDNNNDNNNFDINCIEPLYIIQLHLDKISGKNPHRWIIFISSSNKNIINPKTIKEVTYQLHPTFNPSKRKRKLSPYILDTSGWGTFTLTVFIKFKDKYIRNGINCRFTITFDYKTKIKNILTQKIEHLNELFIPLKIVDDYNKKLNIITQKNIGHNGKKGKFVAGASLRLASQFNKMARALELHGFNMRIDTFINIFNDIKLKKYSIPIGIIKIIAQYGLLYYNIERIDKRAPIEIKNCHNCDLNILCNKVNHVDITDCYDMNIQIKNCMTTIQLNTCNKINIKVSQLCQTFRLDGTVNSSITFNDNGYDRIQIYSFESPNNCVTVNNIQNWNNNDNNNDESKINNNSIKFDIPYVKNNLERVSVVWRKELNKPVFSCKKWKPTAGHNLTTN